MVAAIGLTSMSATPAGGFGTAGLEAQIARYEKQLSDCVNCSSAKTPEGKKAIADVSNKIRAVRARIDEALSTQRVARPVAATASAENPSPIHRDADASAAPTGDATVAPAKQMYAMVGSLVDVFG